ncbi:MAG: hypothetical protein ACRDV3_13005, partial [Acidothermaceae bacterium]
MSATAGSASQVTLADWLRHEPDATLARLLAARPDLLHPVPPDISVLASRASGRVSAEIALDRLDLGCLQLIEALALLPEPTTVDEIARLLGVDPAQLDAPLTALRDGAFVWGGSEPDGADEIRLLRIIRDLLPFPAALGPPARLALAEIPTARLPGLLADLGALLGEPLVPGDRARDHAADATPSPDPLPDQLPDQRPDQRPDQLPAAESLDAVAAVFEDPARLATLLDRLPPKPREVVELLSSGSPIGRAAGARRPIDARTADTPLGFLLAHAVLVAVDDYTVVLPREVALSVRGGVVFPELFLERPPLTTVAHAPSDVDATAAGQAFTVVRLVEALLERWGVEPPSILRAGGVGVRELRRAARELDADERLAAFVIEIAHAAGLLAPDGEAGESWLPTLGPSGYDAWLLKPLESRWAALASAWLATTRVPALVGRRQAPELAGVDGPGQSGRAPSAPNALGPDVDRALAPIVRRDVLRLLGEPSPGDAPEATALVDTLQWSSPRRGGRLRDDLAAWSLEEAEILGITGRGALSSFGRLMAESV